MNQGFKDNTHFSYKPHIVRLGRGASSAVEAIQLEVLADNIIKLDKATREMRLQGINVELRRIKTYIRQAIRDIRRIPVGNIKEREDSARLLCMAYDDLEKNQCEARQLSSPTRRELEVAILDSANIVFTTLNSSGLDVLESLKLEERTFDTLVIDEAAQSIEISTLIPLRFGSRQCILVGDPQQLPATIMSPEAAKKGLDQSLFQRFQSAGYPVNLLDVQYRMHPQISAFPVSCLFLHPLLFS